MRITEHKVYETKHKFLLVSTVSINHVAYDLFLWILEKAQVTINVHLCCHKKPSGSIQYTHTLQITVKNQFSETVLL